MKDPLKKYREKIDKIDGRIIHWLSLRMGVVKKVGSFKKKHSMPVRQSERFARVLDAVISQGEKKMLRRGLIEKIYKTIHDEAIKLEKSI